MNNEQQSAAPESQPEPEVLPRPANGLLDQLYASADFQEEQRRLEPEYQEELRKLRDAKRGCCAARKALEYVMPFVCADSDFTTSEWELYHAGLNAARATLAAPCECETEDFEAMRRDQLVTNVLAEQLRGACDRLKSLCLRWNKMASHFTAGSEFVDDPERVGKALESSYRMQQEINEIAKSKLRDEVKQLQAAVELHKGAAEELRSQLAKQESANV